MDWKEILIQQKDWTESSKQSMRLSKEQAVILYRDAPLHDLMSAGLLGAIKCTRMGRSIYLVDRKCKLYQCLYNQLPILLILSPTRT